MSSFTVTPDETILESIQGSQPPVVFSRRFKILTRLLRPRHHGQYYLVARTGSPADVPSSSKPLAFLEVVVGVSSSMPAAVEVGPTEL